MSKWHSLLEFMQFPLKILFLATLMLGLGSALVNPNVSYIWTIKNENIIKISELLQFMGGNLINIFPILVYLKILTRKFEATVPVIIGVVSYIMMNITMIFFINSTYPEYFYKEVLGIAINFDQISINMSGLQKPYNLGVLTIIAAYFITMYFYQRSRHHSMYGILSFIDHDSWALLTSSIFSCLLGAGIAFVAPYVFDGMLFFFNLIARDITNPVNLMLYGMFERLSAVLNISDIPRSIFWFSEAGGSWLNSVGIKYSGDVAVWTAQKNEAIMTTTSGSFITPYYVINMFLIPSFYIAYYSLCTDKSDRRRYRLFFIIATILSFFAGNPLPAELLMLILSPLLYFIYIVIVGLLFAFMKILNVVVGYNFEGALMVANPGSSLDLIQYFRNPYVLPSVIKIIVIGIMVAVIFFFLTRKYFKKYAFGLFQINDKNETCDQIIEALGGIDNVLEANSTPDKLVLDLKDRSLIQYHVLQEYGAYLILEAKNGYLVRLGNVSTIVRDEIIARKKTR